MVSRGAIVETFPDTGCASPGACYGVVISAGPRQLWVRWESGLKQRLRGGSIAHVRIVDPHLHTEKWLEATTLLRERGYLAPMEKAS